MDCCIEVGDNGLLVSWSLGLLVSCFGSGLDGVSPGLRRITALRVLGVFGVFGVFGGVWWVLEGIGGYLGMVGR